MTQLQRYIEKHGALAGPKLYHAIQSRAAYIGSSRRRARAIEDLTGRPLRDRRVRPSPQADGASRGQVSLNGFSATGGEVGIEDRPTGDPAR